MTTAIYVRISADREGRELGVERQEQDCRALADRLGLTVAEVFSDNDISATSRSRKPRPNYRRMLAGAEAGRITTVLSYSTSRLTRRPREFEDLIDLAEQGLKIVTVQVGEINLNTGRGRERARNDAARDAGYADEISDLVTRQKAQKRARGEWGGGFRPFGFEKNGTTPRPAEQELIRSGCRDILAGRTVAGIARDWAEKIPPPTWRPPLVTKWRPSTVRDILTNPRVAGMLPDGTRAVEWEPLVPEADWRGVVAVLSNPDRNYGRGDIRLLTGIGRCGVRDCGGTLNAGQTKTGTHTYRCLVGRHLDRAAGPVDDLVGRVWAEFVATQPLPVRSSGPSTGDLAGRAAGIRARLAELEESAGDVDGPSPRMLAAAERKLTAELEAVEAEMAQAAGTSALAGLPADAGKLRAVWEAADTERRRSLLQATPITITVLPPGRGVRAFDPSTVVVERR